MRRFLEPCYLAIWRMTLKTTTGHIFYATSSFVQHFVAIGEFKLELHSWNARFGSKLTFFKPCGLQTWQMTLKNNSAPILCYFKLCTSFRILWWIKTGVAIQKCTFWVKINIFFSRVTFKLGGWPWKTIGHLFYETLSFVHHFNAIDKTYSPEMLNSGQNRRYLSRVTEKCYGWLWKNRAPLLCYFKLSASFRTHWWIQTGVTVWKRPIWVKFDDF